MNAAERMTATKRIESISEETRIALLEYSQNHVYETINRLEKRMLDIDKVLSERFSQLDDKIDGNNKWLIGLAVSVLFSSATLGLTVYSFLHGI